MTLGQVLKELSIAKGIGAYKIAKAVGVYHTTVYDWWDDKYRPVEDKLLAYARTMGVTVDEILRKEGSAQEQSRVAEQVFAVLLDISEGHDPADAYARVTARAVCEERRAAIQEAARRFRLLLSEEAGIDWEKADPVVRAKVLRELQDELLRRPAP